MNTTPYTIAFGNWLNETEWQFYCTFTTKYSMSIKQARNAMKRLHSHLTSIYGNIKLFWIAEPFDTKYSYHTHALVQFAEPFKKSLKSILQNAWQIVSKGKGGKEYNNTVIKPFDKSLGAHHYVSKYVQRNNADWDFY